ncbi:voltage-gated ion channel superfamily [Stylonychia lemnae]|uniref:Voltage-gated ion channel superfamily n=1 Tax=Stylonychia lemnae TaxID=5949 RepID=A0A078AKM0_STYLE|nr:voltage-gated ion channel superfamily [Stylonychia lemnae]|eukprot:CDW82905.1 voltage-gated ion channel superfamily [Stylonychia lemnae]
MREVEKFKIEDRAESNKIYHFCFKLVKSSYFTQFISILIVLNTIDLALDRYPIDEEQSLILDEINMAFSMVFMIEMIIKLLAFGFKAYFRDPFNVFDCVVVISSLIDLFVSFLVDSSSGGAITALRGFRLIRIFKLAKAWKKFQNLLKTIGRTFKDISTFSILLFLFMFIYSLLGMEIFAYKVKVLPDQITLDDAHGSSPLANFDDFISSFTTVFIILTNDGWSAIYYNYYRATGPAVSTIFFISLIIIGQKVLLNLFLAILLENFDEQSLDQEIKEQYRKQKSKNLKTKKKCKKLRKFFKCKSCKKKNISNRQKKQNEKELKFQNILEVDFNEKFDSKQNENESKESCKRLMKAEEKQEGENQNQSNSLKAKQRKTQAKSSNQDQEVKIEGKSLSLFQEQNLFRKFCFRVVTNEKFDYFIIFFILVSGVQLAIENPLNDPKSKYIDILYWLDFATTIVFCAEAAMKIIAFGFYFNKERSYLRNTWNKLDFAIIIFSVISLTPLSSDFKIFKMFRVVRGLRLVSKNEGLQLAVKALIQAIPQIANVTIIMLLFFLIFGIIGISYFKGKFYYCQHDFISDFQVNQIQNKWDCINFGANWINKPYSFDNIFQAMKTLFQMATTSGWSDVMFVSISTSDVDYTPILNNNLFWILFFIAFIIVGSFFLLNLFVGVVISTFNREKDKIGGNNLLTDRQKNWIDTKLIALRAKPKKLVIQPTNLFRKYCFKLQKQQWFEYFILACIILNTFVLTLKWYYQPDKLSFASETLNYIFTLIFTMEAVIKLIALGKAYFHENWNIFDFIIVLGSSLSVFLSINSNFQLGGATTIIRAFRITRIFRLVKRAKELRLVFNTFIFTLPALANVGGLLLLLLYLYSIIGVYLFAEVKRSGILTDNLNFETFLSSFITLFSIATGDSWDQIVSATLKQQSIDFHCIDSPTYQDYVDNSYMTVGCGDSSFAGLLFYYSYIIFVNLIFLNLFIAIILQGFDDTQSKESRMFNQETLDKFRDVWSQYDPEATTFIPIKQIKDFLFDIGKPLGWDEGLIEKTGSQDQFIANLDLPIYNNFSDYMFFDVLQALALRLVVQEQISLEKERKKKENQQKDSILDESYEPEDELGDEVKKEQEIKKEIEKDINKLEFQESAQKIQAVKEVVKDQKKAITNQKNLQKDSHFTSLHQAAAQVAIQHMRYIVAKRKLIKHLNQLNKVDINDESESQEVNNKDIRENKGIFQDQRMVNISLGEQSQDKRTPVAGRSPQQRGFQDDIRVEQLASFAKGSDSNQHRAASLKSKKSDGQNQIIQKIYQNVNINTQIITKDNKEIENINLKIENFDDFQIFSRVSSDEIIIDDRKMNQLIESELREMNSYRSRLVSSSLSQNEDFMHLTPARASKSSFQKINKKKQSKRNSLIVNVSRTQIEEEKKEEEDLPTQGKRKKNSKTKNKESKQRMKKFQNDSMRLGGSMGGTGEYEFGIESGEDANLEESMMPQNNRSIQEIIVTDSHSSNKSQIYINDAAELQKTQTLSRSKSHSQVDTHLQTINPTSPEQRSHLLVNVHGAHIVNGNVLASNVEKLNQNKIFGFKDHLKHQKQ